MRDFFAGVDRLSVSAPSPELLVYVAQLPVREDQAKEKRTATRFRLTAPVLAAALDDEGKLVGEPFLVVSTDISTGGIGLMHSRMITAKVLALEIAPAKGPAMHVLAKVVRCRPCNGFAAIGCEFVKRFKP